MATSGGWSPSSAKRRVHLPTGVSFANRRLARDLQVGSLDLAQRVFGLGLLLAHGRSTRARRAWCPRPAIAARRQGALGGAAMTPDPSTINRLYGRSTGHKLRAQQAALVETLLPRLAVPAEGEITAQRLFGDDRPLHFEIGFGSGEHLAFRADLLPDHGFIGCEPFLNGVATALTHIRDQGARQRPPRHRRRARRAAPRPRRRAVVPLSAPPRPVAQEPPRQAPHDERRPARPHRRQAQARRRVPHGHRPPGLSRTMR